MQDSVTMGLTKEQIEIYRRMPPWQKLTIAAEFNSAARELKLAAYRMQHPDWSEQRLRDEVKKAFLYASN